MAGADVSLSVVVPTRNRHATLRRTLASLAAQTRGDLEAIVVDDASAEPVALEGVAAPQRLKLIRNETNQGAARSRNAGIAATRGRWIAFLDDDDEWEPEFADRMLARLAPHEGGPVFSWTSVMFVDYAPDGATSHRPRLYRESYRHERRLFFEAVQIGTTWGLTVGRRCFETVGTFDPSYKLVEDTEFLVRLLAGGCRPLPVSDVLVKVHNAIDHTRLTSPLRAGGRAEEMRRMVAQHRAFLDRHPYLADLLEGYAGNLDRLYFAARDQALAASGLPPGSPVGGAERTREGSRRRDLLERLRRLARSLRRDKRDAR